LQEQNMMLRPRSARFRRAVAATELAVVLPLLMLLWVVAVDWGRIFYYSVTLEGCCRDGAYYASDYPGIYDYSSAYDAAFGETTNLSPAPTVTVTYDMTYNGSYTATVPPASGGFCQVQVSYTFTTVTNFPIVGGTYTLTRATRMAMAPVTPTASN
jgi:hypothetical protein